MNVYGLHEKTDISMYTVANYKQKKKKVEICDSRNIQVIIL